MPADYDCGFYVENEGVPWHGLGTPIPEPLPPEECLQLAGLDWPVELWPLIAACPGGLDKGTALPVTGHQATVRVPNRGPDGRYEDGGTFRTLGVVGSKYRPIQQREMAVFLANLVKEGGIRIHTAGSLRGNTVVWMMGKYPKTIEVIPGDLIDLNFFAFNSHNGSLQFGAGGSTMRIVCANTLMGAINLAKEGCKFISIRHTGDPNIKLEEAQRVLGLVEHQFKQQEEIFRALAGLPMGKDLVRQAFEQLIPDPPKPANPARAQNIRNALWDIYSTSPTIQQMPGVPGTAYAFVNSVTQYVDHTRGKTISADSRLYSAWFGAGSEMKDAAVHVAFDLTAPKDALPT